MTLNRLMNISSDAKQQIYCSFMEGEILVVLRHCSLFADLSEGDLRAIQPACLRMRIKADDYLFHAGSPGGSLYIIEKGELAVEVVRYYDDGHEEVVNFARRGVGDVIGEMSLFDEAARSASVRAVSDAHLLQVDGRYFMHYLERNSKVAIALLKTLVRKLRESQDHQVKRETAPLSIQLAGHLLSLIPEGSKERQIGIEPAPTQKELSRQLGCSREAISRAAATFGPGVVAFERGRILINDVPLLRRLVKQRS